MKSILSAVAFLAIGGFLLYKKLNTENRYYNDLYTGLAIVAGLFMIIALLNFPKEMRKKRT